MKWFVALNDGHAFANFAPMLRVAVMTAQKHTTLEPFVLYDGADNDLTDWLTARNVTIIRRRSAYRPALERVSQKMGNPNILGAGPGVLLRTEIPTLFRERGWADEFVLYTDVDVMFRQDVRPQLATMRPKLFAVAPEFELTNYRQMNTGVMLMNVPALQADVEPFRNYIITHLDRLCVNAWDQTAYLEFYRGRFWGHRWDHLPVELNWKTYWGPSQTAKIVHFHGPKPYQRTFFRGADTTAEWKPLLPHVTPAYFDYCDEWERELTLA